MRPTEVVNGENTPAIGPERHLDAGFWIDQAPSAEAAVIDSDAIDRFNAAGASSDPSLNELESFPDRLAATEVRSRIQAMSRRHAQPLRFFRGGPVEEADYLRYESNLGLEALTGHVNTRFGLVVRRTDMRTWPSDVRTYRSEATIDLDRFQENGLFPGEAVAILHESRDGYWWFACSYNYAAWVRRSHIAVAPRETVTGYARARPFLVVTGGKVRTNFTPECLQISELQLDMGVRLPLADVAPAPDNVGGQNPWTSHAVQLPVRDEAGRARIQVALVARSQDVRIGYLAYTRANVLRQGFKFLGERYGWGHSYNARDCSGLVTDIYRSMGVLLPRNTLQQVESPMGETLRFSANDGRPARQQALSELQPGDLIYSPGHVMIHVGRDQGRPYVLHDTSSAISFQREDGTTFRGTLNGVSVTPFLTLKDENGADYLDTMWAIKKIH